MCGAHSGVIRGLVAVADDLLEPLDVRQRGLAGAARAQVLRLEVAWQRTEVFRARRHKLCWLKPTSPQVGPARTFCLSTLCLL